MLGLACLFTSYSWSFFSSRASLPQVHTFWITFSTMGSCSATSLAKVSFWRWTESQKARSTSYLKSLVSKTFLMSAKDFSRSSFSSLKMCWSLGFFIANSESLYQGGGVSLGWQHYLLTLEPKYSILAWYSKIQHLAYSRLLLVQELRHQLLSHS